MSKRDGYGGRGDRQTPDLQQLSGPSRRATTMMPMARIAVEEVLPMNRNKPPLPAFCAALINWSVDISDNSWATSRNSRQARVAEDYITLCCFVLVIGLSAGASASWHVSAFLGYLVCG
jgi:hypothetical protein